MRILLIVLLVFARVVLATSLHAQSTPRTNPGSSSGFSQEFLQKYTESVRLEVLGTELFKKGQVAEAKELYKQSLTIDDTNSPAFMGLLDCYLAEGNTKEANPMLAQLFTPGAKVRINSFDGGPAGLKYRVMYILMLHKEGRRNEAFQQFNSTADSMEYQRQGGSIGNLVPPMTVRLQDEYYSPVRLRAYLHLLQATDALHRWNLSELRKESDLTRKEPNLNLKREPVLVSLLEFYRGQVLKWEANQEDEATECFRRAYRVGGRAIRPYIIDALGKVNVTSNREEFIKRAQPILAADIKKAEGVEPTFITPK